MSHVILIIIITTMMMMMIIVDGIFIVEIVSYSAFPKALRGSTEEKKKNTRLKIAFASLIKEREKT